MKRYSKYLMLWGLIGAAIVAAAVILLQSNADKKETYKIIYIPKVIDENNDFWTLLIDGVQMAAAEYGMEAMVIAPESEEDYDKQNEMILWAIEQHPDAILLSPSSYTENTAYAKQIVAAGIHLVLIDSAMDENVAEIIVATDNIKLGMVEGSFMKQFVTDDSRIAIIGHVKNSSTAMEREIGVRKGLEEYEDRIVDVVFCDSDYDKAYDLMISLMERYPDINLVAGLNEYSAVGAARAIKDKHMDKQIKVVGIDSSLEEIQLLEEGIFEGIVIQNPFKMGYMGAEAAAKLLRGEAVLKDIDSGCELITKDNVYTEENQKLLFPFREE